MNWIGCRWGARESLTVVLGVSLSTSGCLTPAAERVEMDEAVGHARRPGIAVEVADGLAVVRELSAERIRLYAGAPSIELQLDVDREQVIELEIRNVVPGSEVAVVDDSMHLEPLDTELRTRFEAVLLPNRAGSHRLRVTAPNADRSTPFSIALLSDVQEAIDRVGDIYALINVQPELDFVLGAGDLTEQGTAAQLRRFERELDALNIPYYATLGNHELGVDPPLFHGVFGRGSRSFAHKGVRFTLLDSASATLDPTVYGWLERWLELGKQQTHVVAMHIPPVDPTGVRNGSFASRAEANKLLSRLSVGDVDLTLYGHVHSYYEYENGGIAARISGGGGAIPERLDGIGRHFLVLDFEPRSERFETRIVRVD